MRRVAAWVLALGVVAAAEPPRYALEVGLELVYKTTSEYRYQAMLGLVKETIRRTGETRLRVVRKNPDGSVRLWVRHTEAREGEEAETEFGWFDLSPDGRCVLGPTLGNNFDPSGIFKPFPAGSAKRWRANGVRGELLELETCADGTIKETVESGQLTIGESVCSSLCTLRRDGVPERVVTVWSKTDPAKGRRTTTTILVSSEATDPAAAKVLGRDLVAYEQAIERCSVLRRQAQNEASLLAALKAGDALLCDLRKGTKSPELREELDRCLAGGAERFEPELAEWRWYLPMRGKQAPEWSLEDLDGKPHALKDYRGKIVVLDFWYADCYWCLRAMPALKDLAARHVGAVAVLGMNKDASAAAARQVADALGLTYPTLRARAAVAPYRVGVFPTTFVIDREGVVRRILIGFSPAYGAELEAAVGDLLREAVER